MGVIRLFTENEFKPLISKFLWLILILLDKIRMCFLGPTGRLRGSTRKAASDEPRGKPTDNAVGSHA